MGFNEDDLLLSYFYDGSSSQSSAETVNDIENFAISSGQCEKQ